MLLFILLWFMIICSSKDTAHAPVSLLKLQCTYQVPGTLVPYSTYDCKNEQVQPLKTGLECPVMTEE